MINNNILSILGITKTECVLCLLYTKWKFAYFIIDGLETERVGKK